mgnify:CR=1 FL=1
MKTIILMFFICSTFNSFGANQPKESFIKATKRILSKKKNRLISNFSKKIGTPEDVIKKTLSITEDNKKIIINGHSFGTLGVCELKAEIELKKLQSVATCINEADRVTVFFP